jgi:drug/metabolite transporter (DMT)-like permease
MRLLLLTSFTMIAFASNSILTRMAIEPGLIDPISFALIRVLSGAVLLAALVIRSRGHLTLSGRGRVVGALSLTVYMIGFSLAYVTLDAGLGALILFGVVQITMFSYSAIIGARPGTRQIVGATIAFAGLVVALWPEPGAEGSLAGSGLMVLAGLGWAAYTLSGKSARNPLAETGANFVICLPVLLILTGAFVETAALPGILLAVLCGAITSGLGYALWYRVLPELQRSTAAVVQLSVPVIAILAGSLLLGEPLTLSIAVAASLVVFGIWLAVTKQSAPAGRS